jgi:Zn finger protein HypA/HybF involved in hydrogenase expression
MYSVNINVRPLKECQHEFALCESCFWCATIFNNSIKEQEYVAENNNTFEVCPMCKGKSVSLMHLAKDERYTVSVGENRGLEMKFSKL